MVMPRLVIFNILAIISDYMVYPGSNKLWPKDEFSTTEIPSCCFQPMWEYDAKGLQKATCSLKGTVRVMLI